MRTPTQAASMALGYARTSTPISSGLCDHYVGVYYGLAHSGYTTAQSHFDSVPAQYRHGIGPAPVGALCFWSGGGSGAGHVALSVGGGNIASTDYPHSGRVGIAPVGAIHSSWGLSFNGWTDAYYGPQGIMTVGVPAPPVLASVSLGWLQKAAREDPVGPQGSAVYRAGTIHVEMALSALGYLPSNYVDGSFGSLTVEAYKKWQLHLGYTGTNADGIPGMTSLTMLSTATVSKFKVAL